MRIALIKTSSLGDVVHALPVVSDIVRAIPGVEIDWVVEEAFADLPALHPDVRGISAIAIRRWRRAPLRPTHWAEVRAVKSRLRARHYDLALDLQGLVKSAWVARWTGAPVAGFSRRCAREPIAAFGYTSRFDVDMQSHAIERLRSLAAQALGYEVDGLPRFGLIVPQQALGWRPAFPYVVFLHATSRAQKQWPRERWISLGQRLAARGTAVVLPWGGAEEEVAAKGLAEAIGSMARVTPRLTLGQCARMLQDAAGVVGVDTGLTHLAAGLNVPTIALFAATPAWRFGPYWSPCARSLGADGVWPEVTEVEWALQEVAGQGDDRA